MGIFDNPRVRFAFRALLAGLGGAVAVLQADGSWQDALYSGIVLALAYAGVTSATPIDSSVGVGKK